MLIDAVDVVELKVPPTHIKGRPYIVLLCSLEETPTSIIYY